ncbi:TVP38/TMEM64 family protein [Streptomyces sp. AJS327]|uniref:TVP38/TMEM64 family protein n=1 Tax=Streptomyces sp. AJS327 TaxID=2545265 RepID=UPI0015E03CC9|nr:TVP38/TMEM64 family protein [Streptomyces sp. AJS327]
MSVPAPQSGGASSRLTQTLRSPWSRFGLLLVLLSAAATAILVYEPQRLLQHGWPPALSGGTALALFAAAYGACTAALLPRPVLNLAAGALFGAQAGTAAAVTGTVIGAGLSFGLGRALGQDALRPLLRARWLTAADRQLSQHGFRSMLVLRLLPGIPFAASNYGAAVSRMGWPGFLAATALGCVPNTAAYAVAGSQATTPTSPVFLGALAVIALPAIAGAAVAWRRRRAARRVLAGAAATPAPPATVLATTALPAAGEPAMPGAPDDDLPRARNHTL